jgi:hypothetical protein
MWSSNRHSIFETRAKERFEMANVRKRKMQGVLVLASVICVLMMGTWSYGATIDVGVEADTKIVGHINNYDDRNFGDLETMYAMCGSYNVADDINYYCHKSYMAFDISGLDITTLESATLKVFVRQIVNGTAGAPYLRAFGIVDNDDWDLSVIPESGAGSLTWNNAPKNRKKTIYLNYPPDPEDGVVQWIFDHATSPSVAGSVFEIDVTDYIKWAAGLQDPGYYEYGDDSDNDGMITLGFTDWYNYRSYFVFDTKESTEVDAYAPRLALAGTISISGDFDGDSDVDGQDFLKWQRGEVSNPPSAEDLALWQANFGNSWTLSSATASIPEPNSLLLGALAAVGLLVIRSPSHASAKDPHFI